MTGYEHDRLLFDGFGPLTPVWYEEMVLSARITEVRDGVAERISASWVERDSLDDEVAAVTRLDLPDNLTGRKVYVRRFTYTGQPAVRADDLNSYTVQVVVAEKYQSAGDPPEVWVDERVGFVDWLVTLLGNARGPRLLGNEFDPNVGLWPELVEVTTVHDADELATKKLFLSSILLTFRETAGV